MIIRVQFFFFFTLLILLILWLRKRERIMKLANVVWVFYRKTLRGIEKPLKPMSITPRDTQYFCDDESFFYQFFLWRCKKYLFFNNSIFFFVLTRLISVMSMAQFWRHNSFFSLSIQFVLAIGTRSCINIKEAKM